MKSLINQFCEGIIGIECGGGGADTGFIFHATGPIPIAVNSEQSNIILHSQTKEDIEE